MNIHPNLQQVQQLLLGQPQFPPYRSHHESRVKVRKVTPVTLQLSQSIIFLSIDHFLGFFSQNHIWVQTTDCDGWTGTLNLLHRRKHLLRRCSRVFVLYSSLHCTEFTSNMLQSHFSREFSLPPACTAPVASFLIDETPSQAAACRALIRSSVSALVVVMSLHFAPLLHAPKKKGIFLLGMAQEC